MYVTEVKKMVQEKKVEYAEFDNQVKWELIKFEVRKFTMEYSMKVAREKKRLVNSNEEKIKEFETKVVNRHSISEDDNNKAKQGV